MGVDGEEEVVPARQCEGLETQGGRRECNTWPCHTEWSVGDWDEVCVCLCVCVSVSIIVKHFWAKSN